MENYWPHNDGGFIVNRRSLVFAAGLAMMLAAPAWSEDWRQLAIGADPGATQELYVETQSLRSAGDMKYVWILAILNPTQSAFRYKKELMAIDCRRARYEGIQWIWADAAGDITGSDEADTRWTTIATGSPAAAIGAFVCPG